MSKQDVINKAVRSNEPPVWLLFSAGGSISAFFFPVLILIVGLLLPFGLSPDNIIAFAHTWIGKLFLLVVTIFPMWTGMHRVHHGLHDLKIHVPNGGLIFYGLSTLYTIVAAYFVLSL